MSYIKAYSYNFERLINRQASDYTDNLLFCISRFFIFQQPHIAIFKNNPYVKINRQFFFNNPTWDCVNPKLKCGTVEKVPSLIKCNRLRH